MNEVGGIKRGYICAAYVAGSRVVKGGVRDARWRLG